MSYKAEMQAIEGDWATNGLAFATHAEAEAYAKDLYSRWMGCKAWRVIESDEAVNYAIVDNAMVRLED